MERENAKAVIEAILFTMGESVEIGKLADTLEMDKKDVRKILDEMQMDYEEGDRGIGLVYFEEAVQLCTKVEFYEYLIKIAQSPRKMSLSDSALETLSIIAYKQPVTRMEIEKIRGVSSDHVVNKLVEYGLVMELGRMDAPGRPLLFGTTEQFLRCFGIGSLEDLPEIGAIQMEEFKQQAQQEVQLQLDI